MQTNPCLKWGFPCARIFFFVISVIFLLPKPGTSKPAQKNSMVIPWLVGGDWLPWIFYCPRNIGFRSSSQLTFTHIFFRGFFQKTTNQMIIPWSDGFFGMPSPQKPRCYRHRIGLVWSPCGCGQWFGRPETIQMSLSGELSKKPQIAVKSLDLVTNELFDYT